MVNRSGTMVIPFMTIYLTQPSMGYSITQAGIVLGIFGAGAICGGFLGGRLTDRFGFHPVQRTALIGGGLLFMLLGLMRSYPLICSCTFLLSLVNEAFRPANSTAVAHYSKEENRTRSFSLNRLAINLGWAIGGALAGVLASINYHLLFWVDGLTNLAAAFLLVRYLSPAANPFTAIIKKERKTVPDRPASRDRTFLFFILLTIIFATCFFQLFSTLPLYYKRVLHIQEFFIGMLMSLNGLIIAIVEMVLVFSLEGRRQNLIYISLGVAMVGVSYFLLNLLPTTAAMAVLCMVLVTFGEILSMPFMNSFWISRTAPANRGQYAGFYTIAWSAAQVLGPSCGAQVVERMGWRALWWAVGTLCLLAAAGFNGLRRPVSPPGQPEG